MNARNASNASLNAFDSVFHADETNLNSPPYSMISEPLLNMLDDSKFIVAEFQVVRKLELVGSE